MKRVILESPLAGDVVGNMAYARECLLDSLRRGEAPLASHLLYTQVLDDNATLDRKRGIEAGLAWGKVADLTVVYQDLGISEGMRIGIACARSEGRKVIYRSIRGNVPHFQEGPDSGRPAR